MMNKRYIFLSIITVSLFPSEYVFAKNKDNSPIKNEHQKNTRKRKDNSKQEHDRETKSHNKEGDAAKNTVTDIKDKVNETSKKVIDKSKEIVSKIEQEVKDDIEKLKNPDYPNKEDDMVVKKGSKVDTFSKKIENAKRDFYDYIDDDIRPLSILWMPGVGWFWNSNGKAKEVTSFGWESVSMIKGMIMYDLQLGESHFFMSPGIGFAKQNYSFLEKCIYEDQKKILFKPAKDVLNSLHGPNLKPRSISMSLYYLELLLELQFRSNKIYYKEGLFATIGVNFGWMMFNPDSRIKYITEAGGATADKIITLSEPFGISNYKLGIVARAGMGSFGIFVELVLTNLLNENKMKDRGEVLKPINIGFTIDII